MKYRILLYLMPISIVIFFSIIISISTAHGFLIPDTGVTKCYDASGNQIVCPQQGEPFYGQDANYGPGIMSLTDIGNGTVLDNNTGLMWEVKGAPDGISDPLNANDADNTYSWADAQTAVDQLNAMNYGGHSDWRLPTPLELDTLLDLSATTGPAIDTTFFPNCKSGNYWTSAPYAADLSMSWYIDFSTGDDGYLANSNSFYVRAVR